MVHCHYILYQLRPMLLADVPHHTQTKHVDTVATIRITYYCEYAYCCHPATATLPYRGEQHFFHATIEKYYKFPYLWAVHTDHTRI